MYSPSRLATLNISALREAAPTITQKIANEEGAWNLVRNGEVTEIRSVLVHHGPGSSRINDPSCSKSPNRGDNYVENDG